MFLVQLRNVEGELSAQYHLIVEFIPSTHGRKLRTWKSRNGAETEPVDGQTNQVGGKAPQGQHDIHFEGLMS